MEELKVLTIAPFYNIYIKEFTEALAKYVDEITVFVHYNPLTEVSKYLPKRGYVRYLYRYTKENLVDLEGKPDNVTIKVVPILYLIPDGKNPFLGDRVAKKINNIIKKESIEFNIIHAHGTWISGYAGAKIKEKCDTPLIINTHHDIYLPINAKKIMVLKKANALISVNKLSLNFFKKFNKNVIYIPNGFNSKRIYPINKKLAKEKLNLPFDKKIIFSLGYLIPRKGFPYLLKAMKLVLKERGDIMCFIGGMGPMKDRLQKQIKELALENHVKLIGYVEDKNLWLNATDLFVFPSLEEAFGIPVLEALAVGTPVVATINGGSGEIIVSEEYGLLAKPADPEDLAEKILIALEKDWNREKIRKYAEKFTWDNIAKQTLKVYGNVLSNPNT